METNLILYFSSGSKPSDAAAKLKRIGFKVCQGKYDFVYEWKKKPSNEDILKLGDKVSEALSETGITFKMETK
ncbi:hypothetical protein J4453_01535 [Candidatus Woesearchaeota archaeon]|nr:hypothetical protein [Candidatus Woesearchaeota archaeon]